jgi:hypothetical protein
MMAARVQALIGVAGETITYKRVTRGSYNSSTLQSAPSVQSYAIKAGVRQYRAREIAGLVQQGDREVRIAAADLSFTPRPNDQVVIGGKTYQVVSVNTRSPSDSSAAEWRNQQISFGLACVLLHIRQYLGAPISGAHPTPEGDAMNARHIPSVFIAAVVSALVLAPWRGAALPPAPDLDPIPVQGRLSPDGQFDGTLVVKTVTVADAGRLILTGVLDGTVIRRDGAKTLVQGQPFTAPAVPVDAEKTTDVVLLKMPPIALASVGRQLTLAPVPLDIEAIPDESILFPTLLN